MITFINRYQIGLTGALMIAAAVVARLLAPTHIVEAQSGSLDQLIPKQFAGWLQAKVTQNQVSLFAVDENGGNAMQAVYDDSLLRTYVERDGAQVMLAIAYDRVQREEDRVHRPEICYIAQGFSILQDAEAEFTITIGGNQRLIEGRQMLARSGNRLEAVAYWIRVGKVFTQNPWKSRAYIMREGLAGRLHDGILVRTSQIIKSPQDFQRSLDTQGRFLDDLLGNVQPAGEKILTNTFGQRSG
jgi:EpsI family protein